MAYLGSVEQYGELFIFRVPLLDCIRQVAIPLSYTHLGIFVVTSSVQFHVLQLPDPFLQLHALREQLLPERTRVLELLLLVVEQVLQMRPHVAGRDWTGEHGGGVDAVVAVGERWHRQQ